MKIFNTRIDKYTKNQLIDLINASLNIGKKVKISKINTEFLHQSLNDANFSEVINLSDVNIVDGRGVLWAARYLTLPISGNKLIRPIRAIWQMIYSSFFIVFNPKFITKPIPETIPGVEAFKLIMKTAVDNKVGVFLFGAHQNILELAIKNLKQEFPGLKISGFMNGYSYQGDSKVNPVDEINKTDAKILIAGLGMPKQENWINENISKLKNIIVAVGEGGTLDRIAYPSQKAPEFVNRIGLEWLWRMLFNKSKTETRNRFQRFWNAVPSFMYQVLKWKIKNGQTKI